MRRLILSHILAYTLFERIIRLANQLRCHVFIHDGFSAVGTYLRRDMVNQQSKLFAFEGDGGKAVDDLSLSADQAIHKNKTY